MKLFYANEAYEWYFHTDEHGALTLSQKSLYSHEEGTIRLPPEAVRALVREARRERRRKTGR